MSKIHKNLKIFENLKNMYKVLFCFVELVCVAIVLSMMKNDRKLEIVEL